MFFTYSLARTDRFGSTGSLNAIPPSMKGNPLFNVTTESSFENEIILNNIIKLYTAANKQINFYTW